MKRAVILVIDGLGVGALPDCAEYGDAASCNTLQQTAAAAGGISLPNFQSLGLGNIQTAKGLWPADHPTASFGRMNERAAGKDSTTGHWEIAGFVIDRPFLTYPNGFPEPLIHRFIQQTGCGAILGNCVASGTEVIERYNQQHIASGSPIIYTSADSVFQVAANTDVVPLETLYHWCSLARKICDDGYNISRVIARPYHATPSGLQRLSRERHDYSVRPWQPTLLNRVQDAGGQVVAIGKIWDLFAGSGITHSRHTTCNRDGIEQTRAVLAGGFDFASAELVKVDNPPTCQLVFTNLVDTDTQFGHRRDPQGYAGALTAIDSQLPSLLNQLGPEDLLVITSDHGNDPTAAGTDHTREYVPVLIYHSGQAGRDLGTIPSFAFVSQTIGQWLQLEG